MAGISYTKGIIAHKITLKALWRIHLPQQVSFMKDNNPDMTDILFNIKNGLNEELISLLASEEFESVTYAFIIATSNPELNVLVGIHTDCQNITHAQRDLHLHAFQQNNVAIFHALQPCKLCSLGNRNVPASIRG